MKIYKVTVSIHESNSATWVVIKHFRERVDADQWSSEQRNFLHDGVCTLDVSINEIEVF